MSDKAHRPYSRPRFSSILCPFLCSLLVLSASAKGAEHGQAGDFAYLELLEIEEQVLELLHCRHEGSALEEAKRGFDPAQFFLQEESRVYVTLIYDGAGLRNSLGWYAAETPEQRTEIWHDVATGPTAPLSFAAQADLGILPAETDLRFYLKQDGARGGDMLLFQDCDLNPVGSEQVAARLQVLSEKGAVLVLGFEDRELSGDEDFNDVIFRIDIVPCCGAVTQGDGVVAGHAGIHSDRGARGVRAQLQGLALSEGSETVEQLFRLPSSGEVSFGLHEDRSSKKFDLCVFDFEALGHLNPASLDFRVAAAASAVSVLDDRTVDAGSVVTFDPASHNLAGRVVGFLLVPNNTRETFLKNPWRYSPKGDGIRTKRQPLFSLHAANPGGADQMLSFSDRSMTLLFWEEDSRCGGDGEAGEESDESFDDLSITISPALEGVAWNGETYAKRSSDPSKGFTGEDGHDAAQAYVLCQP